MYKYLLLTGCLFSVLLSACSKNDDSPAKTKTELLTASLWKIASVGVDLDKNGTVDLPYSLETCEKDNTFKFNTNGTGISDEGPTKCDASDPQTEDFTWAFKSGETILYIAIPNSLISGDTVIKTLDNTKLEVYLDFTDPQSGANVRLHFTLTH
ncbi:hypothetical protein BC349_19260 [Flavihumibacter stibioxidans]|uniref:Lipocalin-like domain-containing protein n=2 Tax=Flavihumibacter stibioxidans TaxID=1834163 RepID=A0ABR7MEB4_9BACT|nr:hypothetical protein [Flavihumibacter stibioxidans]